MSLSRAEVLAVLKRVEPALSTKDLIQVFACFCFNGEEVTAFDDVVALQLPFNFGGITGAIRGRVLLDFLSASRAKEVEVSTDKEKPGQVLIKAGRAKLDVPVLPPDDFLFKRPKMKDGHTFKVGQPFVDCLNRASISMGRDPSHPFRLGVTVTGGEKGITFYSSDNKSATKVWMPTKEEVDEFTTVLAPRFVESILELSKGDDKISSLTLTNKWAEATFESGLRLFGHTIIGGNVETFEGLFKSMGKKATMPIPKGLDKCLERALVVAKFSKEPFTIFSVKADKLYLNTDSDGAGKVRDVLTLPEEQDMVKLRAAPELIARALPLAEEVGFVAGSCFLFKGKNYTHVVTVIQDGAPEEDEAKEE